MPGCGIRASRPPLPLSAWTRLRSCRRPQDSLAGAAGRGAAQIHRRLAAALPRRTRTPLNAHETYEASISGKSCSLPTQQLGGHWPRSSVAHGPSRARFALSGCPRPSSSGSPKAKPPRAVRLRRPHPAQHRVLPTGGESAAELSVDQPFGVAWSFPEPPPRPSPSPARRTARCSAPFDGHDQRDSCP